MGVSMDNNRFYRLDEMMLSQVDSGMIPGGHLRIIKDGIRLYDKCFGMADKARGVSVSDNTIYRLYSMTKPVTAVAAMILYDRGLIDLNDSVCWYLDGFSNQMVETKDGIVPANREVKIIDLLTMTAGLMYPDRNINPSGDKMADLFDEYYRRAFSGNGTYSTVEMCNEMGKIPLFAQPGTCWNYSVCADVLGAVVEVVSKKRYGDFLKSEIFTPLRMTDTDFFVPEDKRDRFAEIYIRGEDGKLAPCDWQHLGLVYKYTKRPEFEIGGAGLVSTVNDYERFAQMLLNGGEYNGVRIISRKAAQLITHNIITEQQMQTYNWDSCIGYGYGGLMRTLLHPEITTVGCKGEYGWDGWTGNYFCNDPENDLTFLYFIQVCGGNGIRPIRTLKQAMYSALDR